MKEFSQLLTTALHSTGSKALTTHINPDGDGLAACLAMQRLLKNQNISVDIVVDDLKLDRFACLDVYNSVKVYSPDMQYDLLLIVDLHDAKRLGERANLVCGAKQSFIIDHHEVENDLMDVTACLVEPWAVCTGWMLFQMFREQFLSLSDEDRLYTAKCLYITLLNDTNIFTNANTDEHAYTFSAELCRMGIKPHLIHREFMQSRTPAEMRLIAQVLSTLETHHDGKILFMHSTLMMLAENGLTADATSNLTRWVTDLTGVDSVVYFREEALDSYRLSLRSKHLNVHSIALQYGGGGHQLAAGCHCSGSLQQLKTELLEKLHTAPPADLES